MSEIAIEKQPAKKPIEVVEKSVAENYFETLWGDGKLTRVPVAHLYFPMDNLVDIQEIGVSQLSNQSCIRPTAEKSRYYVCDFIPAWQTFELTFVASSDAQPVTSMLHATQVRRWKRS